jgi:hypothetical protein
MTVNLTAQQHADRGLQLLKGYRLLAEATQYQLDQGLRDRLRGETQAVFHEATKHLDIAELRRQHGIPVVLTQADIEDALAGFDPGPDGEGAQR